MSTIVKSNCGYTFASHIMFRDLANNLRVIPMLEIKLHLLESGESYNVCWDGGECEVTDICFAAICEELGVSIPANY